MTVFHFTSDNGVATPLLATADAEVIAAAMDALLERAGVLDPTPAVQA